MGMTLEEIARARARAAHRDENWGEIDRQVTSRLRSLIHFHSTALFPVERCSLAITVFLMTEQAKNDAAASGFEGVVKQVVAEVASFFRQGECAQFDVIVMLDSDEAVQRDYGGSYFLRLR